jgi:hypothetical protein
MPRQPALRDLCHQIKDNLTLWSYAPRRSNRVNARLVSAISRRLQPEIRGPMGRSNVSAELVRLALQLLNPSRNKRIILKPKLRETQWFARRKPLLRSSPQQSIL